MYVCVQSLAQIVTILVLGGGCLFSFSESISSWGALSKKSRVFRVLKVYQGAISSRSDACSAFARVKLQEASLVPEPAHTSSNMNIKMLKTADLMNVNLCQKKILH